MSRRFSRVAITWHSLLTMAINGYFCSSKRGVRTLSNSHSLSAVSRYRKKRNVFLYLPEHFFLSNLQLMKMNVHELFNCAQTVSPWWNRNDKERERERKRQLMAPRAARNEKKKRATKHLILQLNSRENRTTLDTMFEMSSVIVSIAAKSQMQMEWFEELTDTLMGTTVSSAT